MSDDSDVGSKPEVPVPPMSRDHEDHPERISRNSRYGLILFAVYCVLYGGFMLLSAFAPQQMSAQPIGGVNIAILYGMALIFGALVLAAIYMYFCRASNNGKNGDDSNNSSEVSK